MLAVSKLDFAFSVSMCTYVSSELSHILYWQTSLLVLWFSVIALPLFYWIICTTHWNSTCKCLWKLFFCYLEFLLFLAVWKWHLLWLNKIQKLIPEALVVFSMLSCRVNETGGLSTEHISQYLQKGGILLEPYTRAPVVWGKQAMSQCLD